MHASALELPAAATTSTPASCACLMAVNIEDDLPGPPSDMLMTERSFGCLAASVTAHSIPEMTPEVGPLPAHESTCTVTTLDCLATP